VAANDNGDETVSVRPTLDRDAWRFAQRRVEKRAPDKLAGALRSARRIMGPGYEVLGVAFRARTLGVGGFFVIIVIGSACSSAPISAGSTLPGTASNWTQMRYRVPIG